MATCHYRTGTEQLAYTSETGSEPLVNASGVLKIRSQDFLFAGFMSCVGLISGVAQCLFGLHQGTN